MLDSLKFKILFLLLFIPHSFASEIPESDFPFEKPMNVASFNLSFEKSAEESANPSEEKKETSNGINEVEQAEQVGQINQKFDPNASYILNFNVSNELGPEDYKQRLKELTSVSIGGEKDFEARYQLRIYHDEVIFRRTKQY